MKRTALAALVMLASATATAQTQTITSVIGHANGDGYPAEVARVAPYDIACDTYALYIADTSTNRIRVSQWAGNTITADVVGNPTLGAGVAVGPGGVVFATDSYLGRIWRDVTGPARVAAGSGTLGFAGDGGPAIAAMLQGPTGIVVAADGSFYIADTSNFRIRKVSPDGIISTYAGGAPPSCGGVVCDGGVPASAARFALPMGLALDPVTGDLYVSNYLGHSISVVRRATMTVHRFAGTGGVGTAGDGGPATLANLTQPVGMAVGPDGTVYVADMGNHVIRSVGPDGIIRRVAGTGRRGAGPDGDPLRSALADPRAVALCRGGDLYIADTGNGRVRRVSLPPPPPTRTAMVPPTIPPPNTPTSPPPPTDTPVYTATRTPTRSSTQTPTWTHTATPTCGCCAQCEG